MNNRFFVLIALSLFLSQFTWAANAVCSAFCTFPIAAKDSSSGGSPGSGSGSSASSSSSSSSKGSCSFIQMSAEGEIIRLAWENLTAQCYGYAGGYVTTTSPTPKSSCGEQTLIAATPENACFQ